MKSSHQIVEKSDKAVERDPTGPAIDAIEYCRGQLASMAYSSSTTAREVHILRLRNSFQRAGILQKLRYSLAVLNLMREVQELNNGYWFPTPLRIVPIDRQVILVGPSPTRELQHHFRDITRAGYARVLTQMDTSGLPIQELDDWLGLNVSESTVWSEAQIANARSAMGPTIVSGNVQFLSVGHGRSHSLYSIYPVWTNDSRYALIEQGVVLCRERLAAERFRYFYGQLKGTHVTGESPISADLIRLQFGFASLVGKPFTVVTESCGTESVIHIPANLPRPERQLTFALGVRDRSFSGKAYRVRNDAFVSLIIARLRRLGCEVR